MTKKIRMAEENINSVNLIVLAGKNKDQIIKEMLNSGYLPVSMDSLSKILNEARHNNYAAVLVDQEQSSLDPLELILNLREIDEKLPVLIFGQNSKEDYDRRLLNRTRVYPINCEPSKMGSEVSKILRTVH